MRPSFPASFVVLFLGLCPTSAVAQETDPVAPRDESHGKQRTPLPSAEEIAALPPDGGEEFNRLVFEESPYLQQHARNPVDWYPWGEEAFARARELDRPVFLSVGYSTCHWCHVMEHESFEDEEVARLMNAAFVCVKVDREERPDLDHVFLRVTQAMTGSGGWPNTVIMTAEQKPFFAATYIPKEGRFGRRGMLDLVPLISEVWESDREGLLANAEQAWQFMNDLGQGKPGEALDASVLETAYRQLEANFDEARGGFGTQPKFPVPHNLLFLLQYDRRNEGTRALEMATTTLRAMRLGGIWDHVGFGFHRYSTDAGWLVPHFEKMLYDQALMAMAYTAGWQRTSDPLFEQTAREILTYVARDMTAPEGGFYSAEDADSEGEEGLFYLWRRSELIDLLGDEEGTLVGRVFRATDQGNFLEEATKERTGRNILHLEKLPYELAVELGIDRRALNRRLTAARETLFAAREQRIHPLKDDKILTNWNGLMIAAFARAAQAWGDEEYVARARAAADHALTVLRDEEGRLYKRARGGRAGLPGTLEDYAFLGWGLLDLYETSFEVRYLEAAIELTDAMLAHFLDAENGGFFLSADDAAELLAVRGKEAYDGATPSGNSVAAWNLLRLARLTGDTAYEEHAAGALRWTAGAVREGASSHTFLLSALDFALGPSFEVVIAGDPAADDTRGMLRAFQQGFVPNKVLVLRPPGDGQRIVELVPYTEHQSSDGPATAYVCRDFACKLPTRDPDVALSFLKDEAWAEEND